jgi:hypothetical protein
MIEKAVALEWFIVPQRPFKMLPCLVQVLLTAAARKNWTFRSLTPARACTGYEEHLIL